MKLTQTDIPGIVLIEPSIYEDKRGYFFESYNEKDFKKAGLDLRFVQDNQSKSSYGVIRGLHMQKAPHAQSKLLRVLEGRIFDVAVDVREDSPTYGKWYGIELSEENKLQVLIPKGFCHGFSVLSESAVVLYKCDELYHRESEAGIRYNDPQVNIDWHLPTDAIKVSDKDAGLPFLSELFNK